MSQTSLTADGSPDAGETIDTTCPKCSHPGPHGLTEGKGPHRARITCVQCGAFWWLKKDQQAKRVDRNAEHRAWWMTHYNGDLVCHWCMIRASQTHSWFDIDHVVPLERGGLDELGNTRPLCRDCHVMRHAIEHLVRHARGLSAREPAA